MVLPQQAISLDNHDVQRPRPLYNRKDVSLAHSRCDQDRNKSNNPVLYLHHLDKKKIGNFKKKNVHFFFLPNQQQNNQIIKINKYYISTISRG